MNPPFFPFPPFISILFPSFLFDLSSFPLSPWKLFHTYLIHFIPPPSPPTPSPYQDHDKTQEEVLKHQASISQLKRSFMEAPPPSPPQLNQWEKRLTSSPATIRIQQQQVVCLPGCVCQQLRKTCMTLQDFCQEYAWAFTQKLLFLFFYGYATKTCAYNSCCVTVFHVRVTVGLVAGEHDGLFPDEMSPTNLSQLLQFLFSSWTNGTFYNIFCSPAAEVFVEHSFSCCSNSYFILNCLQVSEWVEDFFSLFSLPHSELKFCCCRASNRRWLLAGCCWCSLLDVLITLCLSVCPAQSHRLTILALMSLLYI